MPRHPDTERRLRRLAEGPTFGNNRSARLVFTKNEDEYTEVALYSFPDGAGFGERLVSATFACLPDTIDLRGTKGK